MDARTTSAGNTLQIGPWRFDVLSNRLTHQNGEHRTLEDRAARVLALLAQRRGDVISRDELVASVWEGRSLSENSVAVVISDLRKALDDDARQGRFIRTVPKRGYRLLTEAELAASTSLPEESSTGQAQDTASRSLVLPSLVVAGLAAVIALAMFLWRPAAPQGPAEAAPVVVTINNVQNRTGDAGYDAMANSISQLGIAYLSGSVGTAALVRDRWDFDSSDPSQGLYEDFGPDARVYHIATHIVIDGGSPVITMAANDPRTNQVFWATTFPAPAGPLAPSLEAHLDDFLEKVLQPAE